MPRGRLAAIRGEYSDTVDSEALVVAPWVSGQTRWWTGPAPEPTASSPRHRSSVRPGLVDELDRYDNRYIKLRADATVIEVREALRAARDAHGEDLERVEAPVSEDALKQLKIAELLPFATVEATLSSRGADPVGCHATTGASLIAGVRPPG